MFLLRIVSASGFCLFWLESHKHVLFLLKVVSACWFHGSLWNDPASLRAFVSTHSSLELVRAVQAEAAARVLVSKRGWRKRGNKSVSCYNYQLQQLSGNLCCNKSGVKTQVRGGSRYCWGSTRPETTLVHLWEREMKAEEGGRDRGRKNKNAGRPKVKLNIKGKQEHPSRFYFSKYKVTTIVHIK